METRTHCKINFTTTATSIPFAAHFARPIPVRQAESVLTAASETADTDERRTSATTVFKSLSERLAYKSLTTGEANANKKTAQGTESANVKRSASAAFLLAPSPSPRDALDDTSGIAAATSPPICGEIWKA